ncbi:hypothetical protein HaLaN_15120, partial [Haematococcus lacustris]
PYPLQEPESPSPPTPHPPPGPRDESSETSESSELSELSEVSERPEVPPPPLTCVIPAGYSFRQGLDAFGNDIRCGRGDPGTVTAPYVANMCSDVSQCVAFVMWIYPNSVDQWYCLKSTVGELIEGPGFDGPCQGTYQGNPPPPPCPVPNGYTFLPGVDVSLHSLTCILPGAVLDVSARAAACTADPSCRAFNIFYDDGKLV